MERAAWAEYTTPNEVYRRAGGRARYNALRQAHATLRRAEVARRIIAAGGLGRGLQAALARQLGVSKQTIGRDVRVIYQQPGGLVRCPLCWCAGHPVDGELRPLDQADLDETGRMLVDLVAAGGGLGEVW